MWGSIRIDGDVQATVSMYKRQKERQRERERKRERKRRGDVYAFQLSDAEFRLLLGISPSAFRSLFLFLFLCLSLSLSLYLSLSFFLSLSFSFSVFFSLFVSSIKVKSIILKLLDMHIVPYFLRLSRSGTRKAPRTCQTRASTIRIKPMCAPSVARHDAADC